MHRLVLFALAWACTVHAISDDDPSALRSKLEIRPELRAAMGEAIRLNKDSLKSPVPTPEDMGLQFAKCLVNEKKCAETGSWFSNLYKRDATFGIVYWSGGASDVAKLQANSLAQALSTNNKRYITLETTVAGFILDFILLPARKWREEECLGKGLGICKPLWKLWDPFSVGLAGISSYGPQFPTYSFQRAPRFKSYFWRLELVSWANKAEEYAKKNPGKESQLVVVRDDKCKDEQALSKKLWPESKDVVSCKACREFLLQWDKMEQKYSDNSHPHVNLCCSGVKLDGHVDGQLKQWKNTGLRPPTPEVARSIIKNVKWCHKPKPAQKDKSTPPKKPVNKSKRAHTARQATKRLGSKSSGRRRAQQDMQLARLHRKSNVCAQLLARCMETPSTCNAVPIKCLGSGRLDELPPPPPRCFKAQGCHFLNRCRHAVSLDFRCVQGGVRHAVVEDMPALTQDTRLMQHCTQCTDLSLAAQA